MADNTIAVPVTISQINIAYQALRFVNAIREDVVSLLVLQGGVA